MNNPETDLDRALTTSSRTGDPEVDDLATTAGIVAQALAVPTPRSAQDRALFIEAVAARKRSLLSRVAAPSIAIAATFVVLAVLGRAAVPGEALYPVNQVLRTAGLAGDPVVGIERDLQDARLLVGRARSAIATSTAGAERLAVSALMELGQARDHLRALEPGDRALYEAQIETLTDRALSVIRLSVEEADRDDNSGPGSGEDDSDNSGPGSDNSGSGSDDSDDDSDNSGPGSDNSGSGSDNSGSGSDDSDDDSDNSGSGSDNSGSGSDSSGSGSGDDAEDRADELEDRADDQADALEDAEDDD
jgi:hypothetical protein